MENVFKQELEITQINGTRARVNVEFRSEMEMHRFLRCTKALYPYDVIWMGKVRDEKLDLVLPEEVLLKGVYFQTEDGETLL